MRSFGKPTSIARSALCSAEADDRLAHDIARVERFEARRILIHHPGQQVLIEAAPVDTNAYRLLVTARHLDHFRELRIAFAAAADIARVDPVLGKRRGAAGYSRSSLWPLKWKSPISGTATPS